MLLERIEENLKKIESNLDKDNFIYQFLEAYEQPKSSIKRLKDGDYNLSKKQNEVIWKKKIYFYVTKDGEDVHDIIDNLSKSEILEKYKIRFLIVTDFKDFLSIDTKNKKTLDIKISEISKNPSFYLPLSGFEEHEEGKENQADIKAAYKMGKLYDIVVNNNDNILKNQNERNNLNIFFTRILFCFFAEDSNIFEKNLFTKSISTQTNPNGNDLKEYLEKIFNILNKKERVDIPDYLNKFPFVNGGLFKNINPIPKLTKEFRNALLECGDLDWNSINPDIFGSMMQSVVQHGKRQHLGMHYTSVSNILKLIKPLFLDNIQELLDDAGDNKNKLNKLLIKIYNLKIFDPACGSGNFLVVAYKELYRIEIEILKKLKEIDQNEWLIFRSGIKLSQFYGIDIDDYAQEIAKLSLWIAEHQMNQVYNSILNEERPSLPLSEPGNIICSNSLEIDWIDFCKPEKGCEIYVIGNPPYLGPKKQNAEHKKDIKLIFMNKKSTHNLDYIACWFLVGAKYILKAKAKIGFVSTNSIVQGEQVSILWPLIFEQNCSIFFAHKAFNWKNSAKNNAGVTCVIIGLACNTEKNIKKIYADNSYKVSKNINPYLYDSPNIIVEKENEQISKLPKMVFGNMPLDNGNLILSSDDFDKLINENIKYKKFVRPLIGAEEYINGKTRYCLWIKDHEISEASESKFISKRIEQVKKFRSNSKDAGTRRLSKRPHQFRDLNEAEKNSLIIPRHTSERREYLIVGFLNKQTIIADSSQAIYDPPIFILGLLSSRIHNLWSNFVGGTLQTTPRYSIKLCYNTFPFNVTDKKYLTELEKESLNLIDEREKYSDKTLAQIYDPNQMPSSLKKRHEAIDSIIEDFYKINKNWDNEKKLSFVLDIYKNYKNVNQLI